MSGTATLQPRWYVIRTHCKQEERAENNLRAWGVETFNPRIRERRFGPFATEPTYVTKSLFPRYIFARFALDRYLHKVHFTRGVHDVVNFGGGPVAVDEEIIDLIRSRVGADGLVRVGDELKPGDEVEVRVGPLGGFVGVFDREIDGESRARILLTTVSYQAHIVVEREHVNRLAAR